VFSRVALGIARRRGLASIAGIAGVALLESAACASVRFAPAATEPSRAGSGQPEEAELEYRRGAALLRSGRPTEARGPLSRAVTLAPDQAHPRIAFAACLAALGEGAAALEALRDVPLLSLSAADAERIVRLARALTDPFRRLGPVERTALEPALRDLERDAAGAASDGLEEVLARFPALAAGHLLQALAAERLGDSLRSSAELRKAAALAPDLPQPHAYLARLAAPERPELAAEAFAEALKRNPLDPEVLRASGELDLDRLGNAARAVDSLTRAAALAPADAVLQVIAARAELTAGSVAAATRRLGDAIRSRRGDARALLRLAAAAYDQRSRVAGEAARRVLTQCIDDAVAAVQEVEPENPIARGLRRAAHEG
jgi:Flp pilus assembly protein TadD